MKHFTLLIIPLTLLLFVVYPVLADSILRPVDYVKDVGDGQFVLVMLSKNKRAYWGDLRGRNKKIRAKYRGSGLYEADNPNEAIWTVNWFARSVDVLSDGKYMTRWGPWPGHGNYSELALAFYENGEQLSAYCVDNLVAEPIKLPHSASHYSWRDIIEYDDAAKQLFLRTLNGEEYWFDIITGKSIDGTVDECIISELDNRIIVGYVLIGVISITVLIAIWMSRRRLMNPLRINLNILNSQR
ncbi:MAG: hypothetical protein AAF639_13360 [Chloroflexota bacterium]